MNGELPRGWRSAGPEHQAELQSELSIGHPLHGSGAEAIAACEGCDDVLVRAGGAGWSRVHLTWSAKAERDSRWPVVRHLAKTWAAAVEDAERHANDEHGA